MTPTIDSIDLYILAAFLLVNVAVSIYSSRKVRNLREYAVGNKHFATGTLTSIIITTWISGSYTYYYIENVYDIGLVFVLATVTGSVSLLLTGLLSSRMEQFMNNTSIAEAMGDLYGSRVQYVAAISGALREIGKLAIQFIIIFQVVGMFFKEEATWVMGIIFVIVTIHTSWGGIKGVTFTNVVHLLTIGVLLPGIAAYIWYKIETPTQVIDTLQQHPNWNIVHILGMKVDDATVLGITLYFIAPSFSPSTFQRIAMAKNARQAYRSFTYAAGLNLIVVLCIGWIALLLFAEHPGLSKQEVVPYLVSQYTQPGYRGILLIGMLAMSISTVEAKLNSATVILTNDILVSWNITFRNALRTAQLCSILVSSLALLLAFYLQDALKLLIVSVGVSCPVIDVAFLMAILGFRTSARSVLTGMACGVVITLYKGMDWAVSGVIWGMLANLLGLVSSHYLLNEEGGWQEDCVRPHKSLQRIYRGLIQSIQVFRPYMYLQKNTPSQVSFYPLIGVYILAVTHGSLCGLPQPVQAQYSSTHMIIYQTTFLVATGLVSCALWHQYLKKTPYMTWVWHTSIFYSLFLVSTFLVITSSFHAVQALCYMLNLTVATTLLHWQLVLTMAVLGAVGSTGFLNLYTETSLPLHELDFSQLAAIYFYIVLAFLMSIVIALKLKQSLIRLEAHNNYLNTHQKSLMAKFFRALKYREYFIQEVTQEGTEALDAINDLSMQLQQELTDLDAPESMKRTKRTLDAATSKLKLTADYFYESMQYTKEHIRLEVSVIPFSLLSNTIHATIRSPMFWPYPMVRSEIFTRHQEVQCDALLIKQFLISGLLYAHQQSSAQPLVIVVEDTILNYPLNSMPDHDKLIDALRFVIAPAKHIPNAQDVYVADCRTASFFPDTADDLTLMHNYQIVDAHYGVSKFIHTEHGTTQEYIVPVRVRDVRPLAHDLDARVSDAQNTSTRIYKEELDFVEDIRQHAEIDQSLIHKAIQMVKKYHGLNTRNSGEASYLHPIITAHILLKYTQDQDIIVAALLHDIVEHTSISLLQLELAFNTTVRNLVEKVTHLDMGSTLKRIKLSDKEVIQKLLQVEDDRVVDIKLAERLHNLRTIDGHKSLQKRKKIADETLRFFVPIAYYRGHTDMIEELQIRCAALLGKKASEVSV